MFFLYEILLYIVFILASPFFLVRRKYRESFGKRLGNYDTAPARYDVWLHAVSVGETVAARTIVDRVLELRPDTRLVITTTTATGQATARRLFPEASVTYFPFDFSSSVRRFLRQHPARVFASVETEIWPNTVRHARAANLRLILLNARLSDRSFPRYRRMRWLLRSVLAGYSAILAREETDRKRFVEVGAPPQAVEVAGNVKFDFVPDSRPLEIEPQLRQWLGERRLFIAGSTMAGEDEMIIAIAPRILAAGCRIAIAPRKPDRFATVAQLLRSAGLAFSKRSEIGSRPIAGDVLLVDTIGELARMYGLAAAAFIGGSLVPAGGHNPIEAAAVGTPTAFGPHMSNFRDVAATFLAEGSAVQMNNAGELADWVLRMVRDDRARAELSRRGVATVERNRGAALRNARRIVELLE